MDTVAEEAACVDTVAGGNVLLGAGRGCWARGAGTGRCAGTGEVGCTGPMIAQPVPHLGHHSRHITVQYSGKSEITSRNKHNLNLHPLSTSVFCTPHSILNILFIGHKVEYLFHRGKEEGC